MTTVTLITGASSGIGAALARHYASEGRGLMLTGRHAIRLDAVADECRHLGSPLVETAVVDHADSEASLRWAEDCLRRHHIEAVIANAGISSGVSPEGEMEGMASACETIRVNLQGVVQSIHPFLEAFRRQQSGQLVVISSVAGLRGLPQSPSYSASKAGVIAYAEGLRGWYGPEGVDVRIVCPGYVTSPMSQRVEGRKPGEISAERAAAIIAHGLRGRRPVIVFPRSFGLGLRLLGLLPARLGDKLLRSAFDFRVRG